MPFSFGQMASKEASSHTQDRIFQPGRPSADQTEEILIGRSEAGMMSRLFVRRGGS